MISNLFDKLLNFEDPANIQIFLIFWTVMYGNKCFVERRNKKKSSKREKGHSIVHQV